jgi:hypothetical protein
LSALSLKVSMKPPMRLRISSRLKIFALERLAAFAQLRYRWSDDGTFRDGFGCAAGRCAPQSRPIGRDSWRNIKIFLATIFPLKSKA